MNDLISGIVGALIGGFISWFASVYTTNKNIKAQRIVFENNLKIEQSKSQELIAKSAKMISIDIISAVFEGLRVVKLVCLPVIGLTPLGLSFSENNCELIERISNDFDYLYVLKLKRIYGILEKIKHEIMEFSCVKGTSAEVRHGYDVLLIEMFADKYNEIMKQDLNKITSDLLIEMMQSDYKDIIKKLMNYNEDKK